LVIFRRWRTLADRATRGMSGFARFWRDTAILACVIKRANDEKAAQEVAVKPK